MSEDKRGVGAVSINSLSKKITSRLAVIVAVMFLLIVSISGMISMISLEAVTKDKLETLAYENVFLIKNGIENSYGQALGFANSLRNISALPPEEQRDAIDHALKGFLLGDENLQRFLPILSRMPLQMLTENHTVYIKRILPMRQLPILMKTGQMWFLKSTRMLSITLIKNIIRP